MAIKFFHSVQTRLVLICLLVSLLLSFSVNGQQSNSSTNTNTQTRDGITVIIIEESMDADGNKTVRKSIRAEGDVSENELKNILREELGDDVDALKMLDNEERIVIKSGKEQHEKQKVNKAWLGVMISNVEQGVKINEAIDGGPAKKSGLQEGDIITALDEVEVENMEQLVSVLHDFSPGGDVEVRYLRDGETMANTVVLEARPESEFKPSEGVFNWAGENVWDDKEDKETEAKVPKSKPRLGVTVEVSEDLGLLVTHVYEQSIAEQYGLMEGDILITFNGIDLKEYNDLLNVVREAPAKEKLKLIYLREGKKKKMKLAFEE